VFLGDYLDSFEMSDSTILDNLQRIIDLKKLFPDKVILLWGNHEMQYLFSPSYYGCTGFRMSMMGTLHQLLNANKDLFQYAFQYKNYIWTHAGIHVDWWKKQFKGKNKQNIADQLNISFNANNPKKRQSSKIRSLFDIGLERKGIADVGGPLWVDITALWENGLPGYHQIVGHTAVGKITTCSSPKDGSVTFCDCLDAVETFHIIEV
jgi:hypothetical protein